MTWQKSLEWLLELDTDNPGVRYFSLTELRGKPADKPEVLAARKMVMTSGPVPIILANQADESIQKKKGSPVNGLRCGHVAS